MFVKPEELICKCGTCKIIPEALQEAVDELCANLNTIRKCLGVPLLVNSGIRCGAHNLAVGGAPNSKHLRGQAADIRCSAYPPERLAGFIEGLISTHEIVDGGLGTYDSFVHYDIGPSRRWKG